MSHWYCETCRNKKEPESVTFEENCADCGTPVNFVDTQRTFLFTKTQGDFYELTGKKPLVFAGRMICGSMDYVKHLEDLLKSNEEQYLPKKEKEAIK